MNSFLFYNLRNGTSSDHISHLFPDWDGEKERLAVFGAHDDDPLLGAGYAMAAAMDASAEVYAVIFCNGDCGYSTAEEKDTIVETRRIENEKALTRFGLKKENIIRFEYPDYSLIQFIGKDLSSGESGIFLKVFDFIRENNITRVMVPNGYREHSDHTAAYITSAFDIVQAGDPTLADRGKPQKVQSYHQYSVWADFSPEDALLGDNNIKIRANRAILCSDAVEQKVRNAIREYASQGAIISDLVKSREERKARDGYIELYIEFDPRPKLNFASYIDLIDTL